MIPNLITETSKDFIYQFTSTVPLYQIAGFLIFNNYNYNINIKDFSTLKTSLKDNLNYIKRENFNYIYIYTVVNLINSSIQYSKFIKSILPNCKIIVYHSLSQEITNQMLNSNSIDIISIGEEETILLDIVSGKDLKDIKGISYKNEDGIIIHNDIKYSDNLDHISKSIYYYKNLLDYKYSKFYILTGKGCIGNCIYCASKYKYKNLYFNNIEHRDINNVIEEISYITNKYSIYDISFSDNLFTSDKEYIYSLMDAFDKYNLNIKWHCFSRVDTIDEELLQSMYNHGCYGIIYGAESVDQNILNFMNKGITPEQVEYAVKLSKKIGLYVKLHYIIGLPGETITNITNMINFCKKINPEKIFFNIATPIPGTKLYDYCVENDLLLTKDWDLYDFNHQIIKLDNIKNGKIEKLQKLAFNLLETGYTNNIEKFNF
jgi:radical SAM superfamily enzyme YgiQ (UPF0313 family)